MDVGGNFTPPSAPPIPKACEQEMAVQCPFSKFDDYQACRSCLKRAMNAPDGGATVAKCKPAAPDKFQSYCCERFTPTDPAINCNSSSSGVAVEPEGVVLGSEDATMLRANRK